MAQLATDIVWIPSAIQNSCRPIHSHLVSSKALSHQQLKYVRNSNSIGSMLNSLLTYDMIGQLSENGWSELMRMIGQLN